jgi:predicted Rossmann fold nucleotide-binding protein DprA/Smf involved in DNA uptake
LGDPIEQRIDDERIGVLSGERALPCEPAVRLIHLMGRSGGWSLDALTEASGLSVQEVSVALTLLELGGRVRRRAFAFDPV